MSVVCTKYDDEITGKIKRVQAFQAELNGVFGPCLPGGKDKMAKAVVFDILIKDLRLFTDICASPLTEQQCIVALEKLDRIIDIYNADERFWKLFWDGQQPIKPESIHMITDKGEKTFINLFEVKEIAVGKH